MIVEIKPCPHKNHTEMSREWDELALERHRQISSGEDLSFKHVVVPTMWQLLKDTDRSVMLDVGAGTGEFTAQLAQIAKNVIAVEPSHASVAIARQVCQGASNVRFIKTSIEDPKSSVGKESPTAAVAVMTLMTAPDLRGFARALATILPKGASFIATLTHPCFWPRYWGYEEAEWFNYEVETFIEAPFTISKRRTEIKTTHIHRPLAQYVRVFAEEGFRLDTLAEPMPENEIRALYPTRWQFPRFLGLRWQKTI